MSFPRYPKYKASGVEWLGEVPEQWGVSCLKHSVKELYSGGTPESGNSAYWADDDTDSVPWVAIGDMTRAAVVMTTEKRITPAGLASKRLRVLPTGTLLYSMYASLGKVAVLSFPATINQAILGIVPDSEKLGQRFLRYWLIQIESHLGLFSNSNTQDNLNAGKVRSLPLLVPTRAEQGIIASFLDRETGKIDALVAEQRRLIDLLREKRQAVISHAVTKGLNPHAPMKPSGIEWLGDVPEHWEVSRIGNVFREVADAGTDELPILSVSIHHGVSDKEFDEEEMDRKVTRSDDRTKYKQVASGDLVYNMMRAWQGGFGTVTVSGMVSPAYVVARPRNLIVTTYVEHLLRTPQAIEQMRRHSRGITDFRLRLYWDEFKNIRIPLLPQHEAIAICDAISAMDEGFDALTAEAERAIDLLQERRTTLISAAVTGKIDVRGEV